jgi:hypothetical protein
MRAVAAGMRAAGKTPPYGGGLHKTALAGDLAANSAYFSIAAAAGRDRAMLAGCLLGAGAGLGSVFLPGKLGLGNAPTQRTIQTQAISVALYTAGGLAAGATFRALEK